MHEVKDVISGLTQLSDLYDLLQQSLLSTDKKSQLEALSKVVEQQNREQAPGGASPGPGTSTQAGNGKW